MKNAIILHGTSSKQYYYDPGQPSLSNGHWLPWLQKQLLVRDIAAATPEVPHAYEPDYAVWSREVERYDLTPDTLIVGHSCGGGFWVRYLSEHRDVRVGKVILVAPWTDPDKSKKSDFFDFTIDPDLMARFKGLHVYYSDNDMPSIYKTVADIRAVLPDASYREFPGYGHFFGKDLPGDGFPELLEELLA